MPDRALQCHTSKIRSPSPRFARKKHLVYIFIWFSSSYTTARTPRRQPPKWNLDEDRPAVPPAAALALPNVKENLASEAQGKWPLYLN